LAPTGAPCAARCPHQPECVHRAGQGRRATGPAPLIRPSPGSPRCARLGSSTWISAGRAGLSGRPPPCPALPGWWGRARPRFL